jgi:demethylmenaquinone methyltransferase / 2-methoxy-6-polyprenyl-1,4-benzoquinol methylase
MAPKKEEIERMFDSISKRYDFLNHFLSLGIDKLWRRKVVRVIGKSNPLKIIDLATGTGDLAIAASAIENSKVDGIDISEQMLEIGRKKIKAQGQSERINLTQADGEHIPFNDNSFNAATIGFGIRNYENPLKGLKEIYRVLDNNGVLAILEFSKPTIFPVNLIYKFYFRAILPLVGRMVSKSENAYTYLPDSVFAFPDGQAFLNLMTEAGFKNVYQIKLTFGIASIYVGEKMC